MTGYSKPIGKTDDAAKQLIIDALEGSNTHGFDLDSIFHTDCWVVIEFLKCDTVPPSVSHPKFYWNQNWRKFASLWAITQKLEGRLYLVNYDDARDDFKVIRVESLTPSADGGITSERTLNTDWEGFVRWYKGLNSAATPTWA